MMHENRLFEALLDVIPFKAYAVDITTYEVVYANRLMRENLYIPKAPHCWERVFGQVEVCSWCSIATLQARDKSAKNIKHSYEFFDESSDKWLKSYDELISWPDGRDVKYSILVDISDQKEIQAQMIKAHAALAISNKQFSKTNQNLQITKLKLQKSLNLIEEQKENMKTLLDALKETNLDENQRGLINKIIEAV